MFARVENNAVLELWNVAVLPPLHDATAALYHEVPPELEAQIQPGWLYTGGLFTAPAVSMPELRASVVAKIKAHALGLISTRIPALSTFEQIDLMVTLWGSLNNPSGNADLAYCRDVYQFAAARITFAKTTATLEQLQAYDVTADGWPS